MEDLPFDPSHLEPDPDAEAEAGRRSALFELGLFVEHPELQDRLILEVPQGIEPVDYINEYSVDHWVRCAFCRQKQLHQHGYTALLPDGDRALCGSCCGERIFKHTHGRLRCLTKARQKREIQNWMVGRLKTGITPTRPLIEEWEPVAADIASVVGPLQSDLMRYSIPLRLNTMGTIDVRDGAEIVATIVGARVFGSKTDFREARKLIQQMVPSSSARSTRPRTTSVSARCSMNSGIGSGRAALSSGPGAFSDRREHRRRASALPDLRRPAGGLVAQCPADDPGRHLAQDEQLLPRARISRASLTRRSCCVGSG